MIVSDLRELEIITVLERGSPNKECIAIKANKPLNLGQYGIMLGIHSTAQAALPIRDNLLWFGDGIIAKDDWVFIYTGAGEARQTRTADNKNNIFTIFWNKERTVFANSYIVPILFRVDAVDVLAPPEDLPQLESKPM